MNILLILSLLAAGSTLIQAARKWPEKDGVPCACNRMHDPVCGSDGQDYPNRACAKDCGKVRSFVRGYCDRPALCGCPYNIATVCARRPDGTLDNFDNICHAECQNGAEFVSEGFCSARPVQPLQDLFVERLLELRSMDKERVKKDKVCPCPLIYSPVCGLKDRIWRDFPNQCTANCAGVETTKPGTCRPRAKRSCPCGRNYSPVCARKQDGTLRDYANECLAECEYAVKVSSGHCAAKPDNSLPRQARTSEEDECYSACTLDYSPVCTKSHGSRTVYSNRCNAECDNATDLQEGVCDDSSESDDLDAAQLPWSPEDSDDRYATQLPWSPHDSLLRQARTSEEDECYSACTFDYIPVCSKSHGSKIIYMNRCNAECDNATDLQEGVCDDSSDSDDLDAAQLPWSPEDSDDRYATQLPWLPHGSDDNNDPEASEFHEFPLLKLFKRMAQR